MACLSVSFEEILDGAAGPIEAEAAARWLKKRQLYERPKELVTVDDSTAVDLHARQKHTGNQQEPFPPNSRVRQATGGSPPIASHKIRCLLSLCLTVQAPRQCR